MSASRLYTVCEPEGVHAAPPARIGICGHRGARGLWPENTLAALAGALAVGVDAIECDVVLTADGHAVLSHDRFLDGDLTRAGGRWLEAPPQAIHRLSLAELRTFDVGRARPGSPTAQAFPDQTPADGAGIPTLDEAAALLAGTAVLLDVELKTEPEDGEDHVAALSGAVASAVAAWPTCRFAVRSFDWRGLHAIRTLRPHLLLGFLTETADPGPALAEARRGETWAPPIDGLTAAAMGAARAAGLRVEPWTVNEVDDIRRLIEAGVDAVCTDYPNRARDVLRELGLPLPPKLDARAARA